MGDDALDEMDLIQKVGSLRLTAKDVPVSCSPCYARPRYSASAVQQMGFITAAVLPGSMPVPSLSAGAPFGCSQSPLGQHAHHRPLLIHPGTTPAVPGTSYLFLLPPGEVPAALRRPAPAFRGRTQVQGR